MQSVPKLSPFDKESGHLNVIIDTPKGSRNKFKFDERLGLFRLGGTLPLGSVFPFDFGYVPSTRGGNGDPLDVLILMDEPAFTGCLVVAKLIGVIEANQTEDGLTARNDRLIAVAADSRNHSHIRFLGDLNRTWFMKLNSFLSRTMRLKARDSNYSVGLVRIVPLTSLRVQRRIFVRKVSRSRKLGRFTDQVRAMSGNETAATCKSKLKSAKKLIAWRPL